MTIYSDMYSHEEFEVPKLPQSDTNIKTPINKGVVTELEINGKKFELVNPEYIRELHKTIELLTNNLKKVERNIHTLTHTSNKLNQIVKDLSNQMDRKIDRI